MNQPRDLAPIIGRMVVNGEVFEGEKLADYLDQMPYDDFVSLIEDMMHVGAPRNHANNKLKNAGKACGVCGQPLKHHDDTSCEKCGSTDFET